MTLLLNGELRIHELGGAAPACEMLGPLVTRGVLRAVSPGPDELVRSLYASVRQKLPTLEVRVRLNREATGGAVFVSRRFAPPAELDLTRGVSRLRRLRVPGLSAAVLRCLSAATWRTRAVLCPHHVADLGLHALAFGEPWEQERLLESRAGRTLSSRRSIIDFLHRQGHIVQEDARRMYDQEASAGQRTLEALIPGLPRGLQRPLAELNALATQAVVLNALVGTGQCPPDLQLHCWARTRPAKRDGLGLLAEHLYDQQRENGYGHMYARHFKLDEVGVPQLRRALQDFARLDNVALRATDLVLKLGAR